MTLKQIRDAIKSIIGNDTELQNADYDVFINEGITNIVAKILDERKDFFPDSEIIALTAGDIDLTPTKTWANVTLVQIDFGDGAGYQTLVKDSLERVLGPNSTDARGSMIFHFWGDTLYLPNFNHTGNVRIFGYIVPTALASDADIPTFSTLLHPLLVTWGVGRAIEASSSSENFLDGTRKRQEFWDTLDQLLPTVVLKDSTNVKSLI